MTQAAFEPRPLFGIGTVARITGLKPDTLRVWERRYGLGASHKSPTGRRQYTQSDVEHLQLVAALVASGTRIGEIAGSGRKTLEVMLRNREHGGNRAVPEPKPKVVFVGEALCDWLEEHQGCLANVDARLARTSAAGIAEEALAELAPVDCLIVECAALSSAQLELLEQLRQKLQPSRLVVTYRMCNERWLKQLEGRDIRAMEFPPETAQLAFEMNSCVAEMHTSQGETNVGELISAKPRRYTERELSAARQLQSKVGCECPRHLADLIRALADFEEYSSNCSVENWRDAAVHATMYAYAGQARWLMEKAPLRGARGARDGVGLRGPTGGGGQCIGLIDTAGGAGNYAPPPGSPCRTALLRAWSIISGLGTGEEHMVYTLRNSLKAVICACFAPALLVLANLARAQEWIDLTHALSGESVFWPTAEPFEMRTDFEGITERGYYYSAYTFTTAEHGGTHIDAPIHFAEGTRRVDEIPLDQLIGHAATIDVSQRALADCKYQVTIKDIEDWEAEHGAIAEGAIVLIHTGYSRYWPDAKRYLGTDLRGQEGVARLCFPGLAADTALWLAKTRKINAVGIDTASIDHGRSKDFAAHVNLMTHNIPAFENVANLDRLPPTGAYVIALPVKLRGGSGGPLRIVARLAPPAHREEK